MERKRRLVRTTVVLDDRLVREAMRLTGVPSKREVIHEALEALVAIREQERIWDLLLGPLMRAAEGVSPPRGGVG
jgi:Arc/MetJ family transcription regulator